MGADADKDAADECKLEKGLHSNSLSCSCHPSPSLEHMYNHPVNPVNPVNPKIVQRG